MNKECKYKNNFPEYDIICVNICEKYPNRQCCVGCKDFDECDIKCQQAIKVIEKNEKRF